MIVLSMLDLLGLACGAYFLGYVCCFFGLAVSDDGR